MMRLKMKWSEEASTALKSQLMELLRANKTRKAVKMEPERI
jgi:hypothetical protein